MEVTLLFLLLLLTEEVPEVQIVHPYLWLLLQELMEVLGEGELIELMLALVILLVQVLLKETMEAPAEEHLTIPEGEVEEPEELEAQQLIIMGVMEEMEQHLQLQARRSQEGEVVEVAILWVHHQDQAVPVEGVMEVPAQTGKLEQLTLEGEEEVEVQELQMECQEALV